jgi:SMC interacting uncharacterized protein involved in chromosome segregation
LVVDIKKRFTAEEALRHPFIVMNRRPNPNTHADITPTVTNDSCRVPKKICPLLTKRKRSQRVSRQSIRSCQNPREQKDQRKPSLDRYQSFCPMFILSTLLVKTPRKHPSPSV